MATLSWPPLIARCKRGVRAAGGDVRETDQTAEERAEWEWAEHLPPQVIPEFLCLRRFESWNPRPSSHFSPLHSYHCIFIILCSYLLVEVVMPFFLTLSRRPWHICHGLIIVNMHNIYIYGICTVVKGLTLNQYSELKSQKSKVRSQKFSWKFQFILA